MDRLNLEAWLPHPRELGLIREVCSRTFTRLEDWPSRPDLRVFVRLAVMRYMDRDGLRDTHEKTVEAAGRYFRINPATITKWLQRYRERGRAA